MQRQQTSPPAVVLLSGGIDSSTCLAIAKTQGYRPCALTFRYQQRHEIELLAAARVADSLRVEQHLTLDLPLGKIGGSALTGELQVPKNRALEEMAHGIPSTYVPARNTIFLACALAWGEVLGAQDIFIGVNALDYSGYPDCRPEYIQAFEQMANLATKQSVQGSMRFKIHTPLIRMTKAEIIKKGVELGVDFRLTHSCYDPDEEGIACGSCDSCLIRKKGFLESGIPDPTVYVSA